jgi:EGF-like domain
MPASSNSRPCSGKGTPVAVMGQCLCFVGWSGPDCSSCAEGYAPLAGVCQRTFEGFAAEAKLKARRQKVSVRACMLANPLCLLMTSLILWGNQCPDYGMVKGACNSRHCAGTKAEAGCVCVDMHCGGIVYAGHVRLDSLLHAPPPGTPVGMHMRLHV